MRNSFNKQYLSFKTARDEQINKMRIEAAIRAKEVRDTHASKLIREKQQAVAHKFYEETDPAYEEVSRKPAKIIVIEE